MPFSTRNRRGHMPCSEGATMREPRMKSRRARERPRFFVRRSDTNVAGASALIALLALAACGNSTGSGATGVGGASSADGASGATGSGGTGGVSGSGGAGGGHGGKGGSGGASTCGGSMCTSSEICVHPSCGGAAPQCDPLTVDGGQCPSGWTYEPQCPPGGGTVPGCVPPPCTPPAPFCATVPSGCAGTPTCACLPQSICMPDAGVSGGQCFIANSAGVTCGSA